jgi:hypothetical protein
LHAIHELEREGYKIKVKDLVERTGLARSTFSKVHVRRILIEKKIVEGKEGDQKTKKAKTNKKTRIGNLKKDLELKTAYIERLLEEKEALKHEGELLRGRLFLLMQKQQNLEK